MKRISLMVVALAAVALGPASAYAQNPQGETSTEPSTACAFQIANTGSGEKFFRTCISNTANVVVFQSPAGAFTEVIGTGTIIEGYAVCDSAGVHGWDSADAGGGFGGTAVVSSSGSSVTLRRFTTDGVYQLDQKFTRNTGARSVSVLMTLKNVSAATRTNVTLSRYVDFDVDSNTVTNAFDKSNDTVWARGTHGITMFTNNPEVPHTTFVETFGSLSGGTKTGCTPAPIAVPATGDDAARINHSLGNLGPNKSTKVTITYKRQ